MNEERRVIFASSLGTVFEWYDFYLYATLAPFFAALFFPKGNDTAALLSAFATYQYDHDLAFLGRIGYQTRDAANIGEIVRIGNLDDPGTALVQK